MLDRIDGTVRRFAKKLEKIELNDPVLVVGAIERLLAAQKTASDLQQRYGQGEQDQRINEGVLEFHERMRRWGAICSKVGEFHADRLARIAHRLGATMGQDQAALPPSRRLLPERAMRDEPLESGSLPALHAARLESAAAADDEPAE